MDTQQYFPYDDEIDSIYDSNNNNFFLDSQTTPQSDSDDSNFNSIPSSPGSISSSSSQDDGPTIPPFLDLIDGASLAAVLPFDIQPSEQNVLSEEMVNVFLPEEVHKLFLEANGPITFKTNHTTLQSRDYYKDLLYSVFNLSCCANIDNVQDIASKLWFERMDEPIPQETMEDNYGVLYFCRQNPSPKRKNEEKFVWGNDQRPDAKKDPDDVQLRYWSYEKDGAFLRKYAMRFSAGKKKADKEKRQMDPDDYRKTPVDVFEELMIVHWVKAEDGRKTKSTRERVSDNNNDNNDNNKPKTKKARFAKYQPSIDPCDRRLKKHIKILPGGSLAKIARMQAVSFIYKNDPQNEETLGFIAQELQDIDERLVTVRGGYLMLKPTALLTLLVQGFQEFQGELERQKKAIEELQETTKDLRNITTVLEQTTVKKEEFKTLEQDVQVIKEKLTPPTPKAFVIPTDIPELDRQILITLRDNGPLMARDIARLINAKKILTTSKTDVNKVLYNRLDRIYVDLDKNLVKWSLKSQ